MKTALKTTSKYLLIFCGMLLLLISLLCLVAMIPQSSIQKNSEKSACYLYESEDLFDTLVDGQKLTTIDNYADTILLGIVYGLDEADPLKSVMSASYYKEGWQNANEAYQIAVTEKKTPNTSYSRYWHGGIVFLKPLLMFFDIRGIRLINAVMMLAMLAFLGALLVKRKLGGLLAALLAGLLICAAFLVPLCLEYISTFLLMLISCSAMLLTEAKHEEKLLPLFFITGMLTCFFDFLTTETLTLTMPLIMVLCVKNKNKNKDKNKARKGMKSELWFCVKAAALWGGAYSLMWISKWSLSSYFLQYNTFTDAIKNAQVRVTGDLEISLPRQCLEAVFRNIALLFPMNFAHTYVGVILILLSIGVLVFCYLFLYGRREKHIWFSYLLMLIGCIPYVRYLVLSNHSYLHYFFTYRAQLVTVTVFLYVVFINTDKDLIYKDIKRIKQWKGG
ncbi:MAG: hypothetical protein WBI07_12870 [Mobilitalea sp.]